MADNTKTIFANRAENPVEKLNKVGTFFNGVDPSTYANIELDPFVTGYAFIYWISVPTWFEQDDDLKNFKVLTQKTLTSISGISDIELQENSIQYGFAGNEVSNPTGITRGNTDFTLGFKEYSGTPVTKMFSKWINYIRDPNTGIATYPKKFNVELSSVNHTAQCLVIFMRPDVTNIDHDNIEKAFLYSHVYPTNIPYSSLYSYELGTQDSPTSVEINFKGVPLENAAVDAYARKVLKDEILNVSEDNNNAALFLDNLTPAHGENTDLLTSGILKDLYNSDDEQ